MLATLAHEVPMSEGWAYEMKWDGVRALLLIQDGTLRLTSRNERDITAGYPELVLIGAQFGGGSLLLDGEIVAINEHGRPDFQALQRRMHVRDPMALRVLVREVPVAYMIFDVLWVNGRLLVDLPYSERRRELTALALSSASWQTPPASVGDGRAALATSRELKLEGIVAKQIDSRY
jgi:bifunctional non-homologous end joining protein LigD